MKLRILLFLAMFCAAAQAPHPSVTLNWSWSQGTEDPAIGFHVQRSAIAGGPYTIVGTVPVTTLTYLDTAVTVGATYYYVVTAYNPAGDSAPSPEVSCTVPFQIPAAPTCQCTGLSSNSSAIIGEGTSTGTTNGGSTAAAAFTATAGHGLYVTVTIQNNGGTPSFTVGDGTADIFTPVSGNGIANGCISDVGQYVTACAFVVTSTVGGSLTATVNYTANTPFNTVVKVTELANLNTTAPLRAYAIGALTGPTADIVSYPLSATAQIGDAFMVSGINYYQTIYSVGGTNPTTPRPTIPTNGVTNSGADGGANGFLAYSVLTATYGGAGGITPSTKYDHGLVLVVDLAHQ